MADWELQCHTLQRLIINAPHRLHRKQPMTMASLYVFVSCATTENGLRALEYHEEAVANLFCLKHNAALRAHLGVWIVKYMKREWNIWK